MTHMIGARKQWADTSRRQRPMLVTGEFLLRSLEEVMGSYHRVNQRL